MLTTIILLAACSGDSTAPDAESPGFSDRILPGFEVTPRAVTIETNQAIVFRGRDRNVKGMVPVILAWTSSGGTITANGTFSSDVPGTYTVVGQSGGKHTDSSLVQVVPPNQNVVGLSVRPGSASLQSGAEQTFTVKAQLASGKTTSKVGVVWTAPGGGIDAGGTYTAGSTPGDYQVVATSTSGSVADTVGVHVQAAAPAPSPPVTLASVVISPASASVPSGTTRGFAAYGRNSNGDSVAVNVTFSATGGIISSNGLYTAGSTGGAYRIIASSSGLADTAAVTVLGSAPSLTGAVGIPFGPAQLLNQSMGSTPFSLTIVGTTASTILGTLNQARQQKLHLVLNMTGGAHDQYLTDGVFDRAKWTSKMDLYNTAEIRQGVAAAVADGTIVGESVMDEPNVHGLGDGNTWGPIGTMTKARVDSLCGYVKGMFPTMPVGVVHPHQAFEPTNSYRVCEFLVDAYSYRFGDVGKWRDDALAMGRRDGHAILFSMNILNGGIQAARDGLWNCSLTTTGGRGTYDPNCRMTADQIQDFGLALGPSGCGLLMWRYDSGLVLDPKNQLAFQSIASRLATLPAKACRRT
ncbi:MAG: hypothetical protein ACTHM9_05825 [Gemmatimonadales bacterium]